MASWHAEMIRARDVLLPVFPRYHEYARETTFTEKQANNVDGRAFSFLLQSIEDCLLEKMRLFLEGAHLPPLPPALALSPCRQVGVPWRRART